MELRQLPIYFVLVAGLCLAAAVAAMEAQLSEPPTAANSEPSLTL